MLQADIQAHVSVATLLTDLPFEMFVKNLISFTLSKRNVEWVPEAAQT